MSDVAGVMLTFNTTVCITKVSEQVTDAGAMAFPEPGRDCNNTKTTYPGATCLHPARCAGGHEARRRGGSSAHGTLFSGDFGFRTAFNFI